MLFLLGFFGALAAGGAAGAMAVAERVTASVTPTTSKVDQLSL
jgi:hypothetical protein